MSDVEVSASRRRAVVTGIGVVAPGAPDAELFWTNLLGGVSAVREIRRFDASGFPVRIAAEATLPEGALEGLGPAWRELGPIARFAAAAARAALADANLPGDGDWRQRAGVAAAAGMGSYTHREVFSAAAAAAERGFSAPLFNSALRKHVEPRALDRQTPGAIAAHLARQWRLGGEVLAPMTAGAGGTQAIGDALRWIRSGRADVVLAGGSDSAITPMGLASFCLLGALSTRNAEPEKASRPFDAERDGFVLGEGAGFLILEEREHALARGARIRAEVAGFGSACDAYRVTEPHPQGEGAFLAMRRALADAGLAPADIGYVNAHGTSTQANDRIEAAALFRLFGDRTPRLPVSSTKSMIGHLTVAAGAVEAAATAMTLERGVIPPTLNQEFPDPACPLDTVREGARRVSLRAALSNSFAFGGQTACLVLLAAS